MLNINEAKVQDTRVHSKKEEIEEQTIRPRDLNEFVGQTKLKNNLSIFLKAAKKRKEPLEHTLFYGPPGLGKTTLSMIIAKEMGSKLFQVSGPAIDKQGDLASILTNIEEGDVLFIDEIHRMKTQVEEILYSALEDYYIDIIIGKGPTARSMRIDLPRFTLVGATTKVSMVSAPLRDRLGQIFKLDFYSIQEIGQIINRSANFLNIEIDEKGTKEIAKRARFTPRIANRLLRRIRDFAEIKHEGKIDIINTISSLNQLEIDEIGLDATDRALLRIIIENYQGGPVGLNTLAASLSEDMNTIEDMYEPFLLKLGFLERTPRGRKATHKAYEHLKISRLNDLKMNI
jgi:holliday junction DNA helicase RuvB